MSDGRANRSGTNRLNPLAAKVAGAEISRGTVNDANHAAHALLMHLEDLNTQLRLLPLNSRLRGPLITRIRDVEDTIGQVEGL